MDLLTWGPLHSSKWDPVGTDTLLATQKMLRGEGGFSPLLGVKSSREVEEGKGRGWGSGEKVLTWWHPCMCTLNKSHPPPPRTLPSETPPAMLSLVPPLSPVKGGKKQRFCHGNAARLNHMVSLSDAIGPGCWGSQCTTSCAPTDS